ncbi:MAG TPA: carboxymuconolactone decarboxylase family protein [Solirubrobacteraceae bacterium]|nr:carboxymuconolactone decarboxylase family protein [Solirubrobacteraceae bacterium]
MDDVERLLRLLSINDEASIDRILAGAEEREFSHALGRKVNLLVRLGALLALGAPTTSLKATVQQAVDAGATEAEITDVLVTVAPAVGLARVVASAPRLATALGYDIDSDD